jgi:hypothetical protein
MIKKHLITNERGNIPIEPPLREYVIKTLTFDIIFREGKNEFKLDVEKFHIDDVERISKWVKDFDCEAVIKDEYTLLIRQVNPIDIDPKGCPFCGAPVEFSIWGWEDRTTYKFEEVLDQLDDKQDVIPRCSMCSCTLGSFNSIREAIQYWNDRGNRNG